MRTVLYLHSSSGRYGADQQLEAIASGLDPARYRALVVLPGHGELAARLRAAGVEVLVRPLAVLRRSLLSARGLGSIGAALAADSFALARLARARDVALVHSNTSVTLGGVPAARACGAPHVWHVREIYSGFERWWPAYRRLLETADALACISAAVAAQFPPGAPTRVVYDGLPPAAENRARAERGAARAALGLPADAFVCLLVGRISDWKGQDVLARALASAPLRELRAVGLVAGDAWPGEEHRVRELARLAAELDLGDRFRLLGFREDLDALFGASDVVVVPSTRPEPLCNAAIEAAAAGCCVVASANGGLPEVIADGATGRLVAPGDPRALAAALAELQAEPGRREVLGRAAAQDVRVRFSTRALLERTQALYDELLADSG